MEDGMTCTHRIERGGYITRTNDWTGEDETEWESTTEHTTRDIGVGAFQCTQCGEVMYYTGSWKKFYTEGVPCPSSEYSEKTGDVHKVRKATKAQEPKP
jgi:hypothetical protein